MAQATRYAGASATTKTPIPEATPSPPAIYIRRRRLTAAWQTRWQVADGARARTRKAAGSDQLEGSGLAIVQADQRRNKANKTNAKQVAKARPETLAAIGFRIAVADQAAQVTSNPSTSKSGAQRD
jgi:hypothetical protein